MRRGSLVLACALLVAACGPGSEALRDRIDGARVTAGASAGEYSLYLDAHAVKESVDACGRAHGRPSPPATFDGETAADRAFLTRTSALVDADAAVNEVFDGLTPVELATLTDVRWDRQGVGTYRCPDDGLLYVTGVLTDFPTLPASGRYVSNVFPAAQIEHVGGVRYGTAPLCVPTGNDRIMDLFIPTGDALAARPTIVLVYGGGFVNGSRLDLNAAALVYARKGWVAVTIDYRTCPGGFPDSEQLQRAADAIDDGMEAVRFLHANAALYGIDTSRIAVFGSSAGGAVALGTGLLDDPTPGGPLAAQPFRADAVVSTGAHLTPALDAGGLTPDPAPALMFRYETDTGPSRFGDPAWPYAYRTCGELHSLGGVCDFVLQPGGGHTIPLGAGSPFFVPKVGPWLYEQLDLAAAT